MERCVPGDDVARVPREKGPCDALEAHGGAGIAFTLNTHDVDPEETVE